MRRATDTKERRRRARALSPPGKESFVFHSHERDEELLYIPSGEGRAEIGDESDLSAMSFDDRFIKE